MRLLASKELKFQWILPGHGRMMRFASDEERVQSILEAARIFDSEDEGVGKFGIGYN